MAKNKVSEWSSTPANNTDIANIDIAEGCAPSGVNNAIREIMAQVKDMQTGADGDNFTVGNNLSVLNDSTFTGTVLVGETLTSVGVITASAGFSGNLTGNVTGNCSGTSLNVTGTVAVANGGTGATSLTANNVILGNGTSAVQVVAPGTSGNVLVSNGTTWVSGTAGLGYNQTWQNVTRTAGTTYTNSTGKPICLVITTVETVRSYGLITVTFSNGVTVGVVGDSYSYVAQQATGSIIIPVGETYVITNNMGGTAFTAQELR
jgi:hypothetical protein